MELKRIPTYPGQMGGVPCLPGRRIPVVTIAGLTAEGHTTQDILARAANGPCRTQAG
jgi:uncharacterized protein (DUF433 family)